jgi:[ribosomal protein S5]-alanine N-acetyltransferase
MRKMGPTPGNTPKIFLRPLDPAELGPYYVNWMNDPEVVQYLESRWCAHTLDSIRNYVRQMNESSSDFLYGIFLTKTGRHIGNIKIGEINRIHKFANIGLLIGEKSCRGRGFGTQAIILATEIAFRELHLNCLTAGIYSNNQSSYRAFLKAGWKDVGRYKKYRLSEGIFVDQINVQICDDA